MCTEFIVSSLSNVSVVKEEKRAAMDLYSLWGGILKTKARERGGCSKSIISPISSFFCGVFNLQYYSHNERLTPPPPWRAPSLRYRPIYSPPASIIHRRGDHRSCPPLTGGKGSRTDFALLPCVNLGHQIKSNENRDKCLRRS